MHADLRTQQFIFSPEIEAAWENLLLVSVQYSIREFCESLVANQF